MHIAKHARELALAILVLLLIPLLFMIANGIAPGGSEPPVGIAAAGICLEQPREPAAISREEAIQAARDYLPTERESEQVSAEHLLYSDDSCNQLEVSGSFTSVPAWVVTFHNAKIALSDTNFSSKNHVIVHAKTGEILREIAVR